MQIECPKCWPEKDKTRHRVKWQPGEKESRYEIRCSRCGYTRTIASYDFRELKKEEVTS